MKRNLLKSLTAHFVLFITCLIVITIAGTNFYLSVLEDEKKGAYNNLSILAEIKTSEIIKWRNERIGDAKFIQNNLYFKKLVLNFLNNPDSKNIKKEILDYLKPIHTNHDEYINFLILNTQGKIYSLFKDQDSLFENDNLFLSNAYNENKIVLTNINKNKNSNEISLGCFIPFYLPEINNEKPFAVIKLIIDPTLTLYPLISRVSSENKTAETFIVRRDGDSVTFLNKLRYRKNSALIYKLPLSMKELPAAMAVKGKTGIFEGVDYSGNKVLAHLGKIEGSSWYIVSEINLDEVYAPIKKQGTNILIGAIMLSAICGFIIFSAWRNQKIIYLDNQLKIEQTLNKKDLQFRNIVETTVDGVITVDENQKIILFNKASEKILGINAEQAIGLHINKFIPETFHEAHIKNVELYGKSEIDSRVMGHKGEIVALHSSGKEIAMEASISHFEIEGHKYYTVIHRDITTNKKLQEDLKSNQERLLEAQRLTHIGSYSYDIQTGFLEFTEESYKILELDPQDGIPTFETILSLIHPEDRKEMKQVAEYGLQKNTSLNVECRLLLSRDKIKYINVVGRTVINAEGKCIKNVGAIVDITDMKVIQLELKETLAKLQESENNLKEAQRLAHAGSYIYDWQTGNAEWSEELFNIFEISPKTKTPPQSEITSYIHPDDREQVIMAGIYAAENRTDLNVECRLLLQGNKTKYINIISKPVMGNSGKITQRIGVVVDITERKNYLETIRKKEEMFVKMFQKSPVAMNIIDTESYRSFDINPAFERLLGYSRNEIIGKTSLDLNLYFDLSEREKIVTALKKGEQLRDKELAVRRKNGEKHW